MAITRRLHYHGAMETHDKYLPLDPRRVGMTQRRACDFLGVKPVTVTRAVSGDQEGPTQSALAYLVAVESVLTPEQREEAHRLADELRRQVQQQPKRP